MIRLREHCTNAKRIGEQHDGMETLVIGDLHLIGGALSLLQPLD